MDMEIAATGQYPFPPDWKMGLPAGAQLDAQGVLVGFPGGGLPFPDIQAQDPQAAVKVIWNMLWRPGTQNFVMPMVAWSRSPNGQLDRQLEFTSVNVEYARGEHCLVPGYEDVRGKSLMEFRSPRDMAGAKNLSVNYVDHYKEDDGWLYMPAQRKPRRTLASERTSEVMGMDFTREDQMGFGGKVHEQTWTYLGKRKVLATINVRDNPEAGGPHLWVPNKARWEVRDYTRSVNRSEEAALIPTVIRFCLLMPKPTGRTGCLRSTNKKSSCAWASIFSSIPKVTRRKRHNRLHT